MEKNNNLSSPYAHVGVIGAGAWGTALALVAAVLWTAIKKSIRSDFIDDDDAVDGMVVWWF